MADRPPAITTSVPAARNSAGTEGVPVIDLTRLLGDAYMQADLLRGDALALEQEDARARPAAVARMRHAAAHIEQLARALDGSA